MNGNTIQFILAALGAGAWFPQIVGWARSASSKPKLAVYPAQNIEVGFTDQGPVVALPLVIQVKHKDSVVASASSRVVHMQGETHEMQWRFVSEVKGYITGIPAPIPLTFQSVDLAIAIPLTVDNVVNRKIIFHERGFDSAMQEHMLQVSRTIEDNDSAEQRVASRPWKDAVEWYRKSCFWKEGRYTIRVSMTYSDARRPADLSLSFTLTRDHIALLEQNRNEYIRFKESQVRGSVEQLQQPQWRWCYPPCKLEAG